MALVSPFAIYTLGPGTSNTAIEPVLELSNQIFDSTSSPRTHHSSLEEWHKRLSQPNSILLYGTGSPSLPAEQVRNNDETFSSSAASRPIGFIFAHPKSDPSLPCPTLHIWLAGISEKARGMGLFAALMDKVEEGARSKGIQALSVCTFPAIFARMFAILQTQGWEVKMWMNNGTKALLTKRV